GVGPRALGIDWRRRLSLDFYRVQLNNTLQVIRPCRESETGWTPKPAMAPGNHSSLELNERGPALNVFWSRPWRDGRRVGERTRLSKTVACGNRTLDQENRAGGSRVWSNPVRSFRFEKLVKEVIHSSRARPRWLTERIASMN